MIAIFLGWMFANKIDVLFANDENVQKMLFPSESNILVWIQKAYKSNPSHFDIFKEQKIERPLFYNLLASYLSMFKQGTNLLKENDIAMFLNIFPLIMYIIFFSLVSMTVFYADRQQLMNKLVLIPIFSFIASFFNLSMTNVLMNFNPFLGPLVILSIWLHYANYNEVESSLSIIISNIISFMAISLNLEFLLLFTIISIITVGISYYTKKQKATDSNVFNFFIIIISWSLLFQKVNYLSMILFVVVLCIYIFYLFYRTSKLGIRVNDSIDRFMYKWIVVITSLFIFLVILFITIYYASNDYTNQIFLIWELQNYFGISLSDTVTVYWVINVSFWLLNIIILCYAIYTIYAKRKKIGQIKYMEISFLCIILFWNPFSLDLIQTIFKLGIFNVNFQQNDYINIFLIPVVPLYLNGAKNCINSHSKNIYNISYTSGLMLVSIASILLLNLI